MYYIYFNILIIIFKELNRLAYEYQPAATRLARLPTEPELYHATVGSSCSGEESDSEDSLGQRSITSKKSITSFNL